MGKYKKFDLERDDEMAEIDEFSYASLVDKKSKRAKRLSGHERDKQKNDRKNRRWDEDDYE